jgi:S-adenosylmethionine:tRNA ribosyltransferase-isomerase
MKIEEFYYNLPARLVAQEPASPRDHSRMLVLDQKSGRISHQHFFDLPKILNNNYVLVFNDTRVIPARTYGQKQTGGKVEVFFLKKLSANIWEVLVKGKVKVGTIINLNENIKLKLVKADEQIFQAKIIKGVDKLSEFLEKSGHMPLPPYIKKKMVEKEARQKYQTIFARVDGSVAAPTASLHFTQKLLNQLKKCGVESCFITLHVGWGTFAPIKTKKIEDHQIHEEHFEISANMARFLNQKIKQGKKIVAVGTTVARTLESAVDKNGLIKSGVNKTRLFIYPPYQFKVVKGLITNFHLPKSSLLTLVSAFAGREKILRAYNVAIKKKYRFFSFGDAMFIR